MVEKIVKIIEKYGIKEYGFCPFFLIENKLLKCAALKNLPSESNTVITLLFPYKVRDEKAINISDYAAVDDYHNICGEILKNISTELKKEFKNFAFEWFIDNSPIPEVKAAALSGLGVVGLNKLLINERYGSYVFIGEIVTDLKIQTVNNNITYCIKCNKCIDACPTKFLKDKNNKCLSKITQQKGELEENEKNIMRKIGTVWGCDICQQVCPMNKNKEKTNIEKFKKSYKEKYTKGENIKNRAFEWRGEKVILRNIEIFDE